MLTAFFRIALLCVGLFGLGTILAFSLVPGELRPHALASDHMEHLLAYCCVASALCLSFPTRTGFIAVTGLLVSVAGLTEFAQGHIDGRQADLYDFIASLSGLGIGLLSVTLLNYSLQRRRTVSSGSNGSG